MFCAESRMDAVFQAVADYLDDSAKEVADLPDGLPCAYSLVLSVL